MMHDEPERWVLGPRSPLRRVAHPSAADGRRVRLWWRHLPLVLVLPFLWLVMVLPDRLRRFVRGLRR